MASKAIGFLNFKFGADLGGFDRAMKKAQRNLKKFGKSVERTGKKLTSSLTLPIIAVGAGTTKVFMDFEQAMLKVEAVSGATAEQMEMLTETAKRLGATTMFSASQVAELQLNLSKLGLTPDEIDKATESILRLSQATGEDLGETATVVASTMRAFGLTAQDTQRITDVMADSFSSTALDLNKFSTAMATLAPVAKESGVEIEKASALVGVLANNGVDASTAGTALRNIFLDLAKQGMSLDQALAAINNSTDPLTAAFDMFGKRGATVATILSKNQEEIRELTQDFIDSKGEAASMADTMDRGLAGAMRKLKSQTEAAGIELGEVLAPTVNKLAGFVGSLMDKFTGLSDTTKKLIVIVGGLVAGIGPLLILIGKVSLGVVALSGAFRTLTAVMTKNPIGLIAVALTTALGAWYSYNEIVKATTRSQNAFNGVAESTDDAVKRITKSVTGMGKDAFQTQIEEIEDLIKTIKGFEIKPSQFTKGVGLSDKQKKQIQDLNMLLFRLKKRQAEAKEETEKLKKSFENLGNETENEKEKITALNIELAHTKQISESLTPSLPTKSFEDVTGWVTKLTQEQKLAIEGFKMFGDVLTSSLDKALSSQEKFFPLFIANLKKAIKQLLIQAAVMTVIASIMPTSLAGSSGLSTNFVTNLGSILGVSEFAQGGLVTGPTLGLIGEGIGTTASNPEVIAPLDRLKQFMGGGTQNVVVEGVIKGNDIFLSNRNTGYNRQRSV